MDVAVVRSLVQTILEQAPVFAGRAELLGQVPTITVVGGPVTMLELSVDQSLPAGSLKGPVPGICWVRAPDGTVVGTMLVWVQEGFVDVLEFGWVTDDPPTELPDPATLSTDR